jgi:hypothetical protein
VRLEFPFTQTCLEVRNINGDHKCRHRQYIRDYETRSKTEMMTPGGMFICSGKHSDCYSDEEKKEVGPCQMRYLKLAEEADATNERQNVTVESSTERLFPTRTFPRMILLVLVPFGASLASFLIPLTPCRILVNIHRFSSRYAPLKRTSTSLPTIAS